MEAAAAEVEAEAAAVEVTAQEHGKGKGKLNFSSYFCVFEGHFVCEMLMHLDTVPFFVSKTQPQTKTSNPEQVLWESFVKNTMEMT